MSNETNLQKGQQVACDLTVERFSSADPAELARRCRAEYTDAGLRLIYLGQAYIIRWPSGEVEKEGSEESIPLSMKVLLLNYVLSAHGEPTGELISFRDIPGAATYEPSFNKRALNPLVKTFDGKPDLLYAAAERLGGTRASIADASVTIPVLPLLQVTYGIWHGDEEFPASGVILFDSSARRLLPIECLVAAASNGVYALMKSI